jgi:hypothetical protein
MLGKVNTRIPQIFCSHEILPRSFFILQLPPPFAHEIDIKFGQIFYPKPPLILGLKIHFHLKNWYFLLLRSDMTEHYDIAA